MLPQTAHKPQATSGAEHGSRDRAARGKRPIADARGDADALISLRREANVLPQLVDRSREIHGAVHQSLRDVQEQ
jgi:hypothetical protein